MRIILILIILTALIKPSAGQEYWHSIEMSHSPKSGGKIYQLNIESFLTAIKRKEYVSIPTGTAFSERLVFEERSNFSAELAAKYPAIKSYVAQGASSTIYLDIYKNKIHLFSLGAAEASFIEPIEEKPDTYEFIQSKNLQNISSSSEIFQCQNQDIMLTPSTLNQGSFRNLPPEKISLRTYRMAIATTGEFSNRLGSTKEEILAGLNGHLTRINAVYIKESAIQFNLVANNDTLFFTDPLTDPYTNGNTGIMLDQNPTVLNDRIGLNNYDIGHVFGTNAGGIALLSSVCTANKGAGVSCSYGPFTDLLFYTIPCHEIGHQLSATHIFNLCDNSNETSSSGFEPGSGSTIMSYAGASNCGPNYVQALPDPYFHAYNLQQIKTYSKQSTGSLCGTKTDLTNVTPVPVIMNKTNGFIPIGTPFELSGTATDDLSVPVYTWEQLDLGPKSILGSPVSTAPLFRSYTPSLSGVRIFPILQDILFNRASITEVLPTTTRPLTFRFTARDLDPSGGGTQWLDMGLQTTLAAGPFNIIDFNRDTTLNQSSLVKIKWNVAHTDKSPVSCNLVNVFWSDDGGNTFRQTLASDIANDGAEWITMPSTATDNGRIKIKASENVFFDINNGKINLSPELPSLPILGAQSDLLTICNGETQSVSLITSNSSNEDSIRLLIPDFFPFLSFKFGNPWMTRADTTMLLISVDENALSQILPIMIKGIRKNQDTVDISFNIKILSGNQHLLSPMNGADQVSTNTLLKWQKISAEGNYVIQLSENASFDPTVWSKIITEQDTIGDPDIELAQNMLYFWRIRPQSFCANTDFKFNVFHTQSLACKTYSATDLPKFISATGTPTLSSSINVPDSIALNLITLPIIRGAHDFVGDLTLSLKTPNGDSSILWARQCNNLSNFNLGLDDQALIDITCPLTDRKLHKPLNPLSALTRSNSKGIWSLKIQDGNSGAGGSMDEWSLQLCGAVPGNGPILSNNKPIETFEFKTVIVNKAFIDATDQDSSPDQITYTLLETPSLGVLLKNGVDTIKIGSSFKQSDLNSGSISFTGHSVIADSTEHIKIILVDEKNNWSGIQTITLKILNDITIAVINDTPQYDLKVFPNPFGSYLRCENSAPEPISINIFSIQGRLLRKFNLGPNEHRTEYVNLPKGLYILKYIPRGSGAKTLKIICLKS